MQPAYVQKNTEVFTLGTTTFEAMFFFAYSSRARAEKLRERRRESGRRRGLVR